MAKPTKYPEWASVDQVDGVSGQNNVVEPSEAQKDSGWTRQALPPRQFDNWWKRLVWNWVTWFDERETNLSSRMTTAESNITSNDVDIADHESRISAIEAPAVTGFTPGQVFYIDDDGDSQGGNGFNVAAAIGAAWESIGPTGSGATNIWTALDALHSNAVSAMIKFQASSEADTSAGICTQSVYTRRNGATSGLAGTEAVATYATYSSGRDFHPDVSIKPVPLNARKFDLYRLTTESAGFNENVCSIFIEGFTK